MLGKVDELQKGFNAAFIKEGHLRGTLEEGVKNEIDGALIPIINFGIVTDPAIIRDTVQRMELLHVVSGGYRRVRGTYTDPAIYEYWYEQEEFLFVDLEFGGTVSAVGKNGRGRCDAGANCKEGGDRSRHHSGDVCGGSLQAVSGKDRDPTGALPMVGYGAGAFVLHILEREQLRNASLEKRNAGAGSTPAL